VAPQPASMRAGRAPPPGMAMGEADERVFRVTSDLDSDFVVESTFTGCGAG
jgi:hypothetical protein